MQKFPGQGSSPTTAVTTLNPSSLGHEGTLFFKNSQLKRETYLQRSLLKYIYMCVCVCVWTHTHILGGGWKRGVLAFRMTKKIGWTQNPLQSCTILGPIQMYGKGNSAVNVYLSCLLARKLTLRNSKINLKNVC